MPLSIAIRALEIRAGIAELGQPHAAARQASVGRDNDFLLIDRAPKAILVDPYPQHVPIARPVNG